MAVSQDKRRVILRLRNKGESYRYIARVVDVHHSTVARVIKRFHETGAVAPAPIPGRPRALSKREQRYALRRVQAKPICSIPALATELSAEWKKRVTAYMLRLVLRSNGFKPCKPAKKPLLSAAHKKARLAFAQKYVEKGPEFWRRVVFSDESSIKVFPTPSGLWVWRRPGERFAPRHFVPTVQKGGGSFMVWGCLTSKGVGWLAKLKEGADSQLYTEILEDELEQTIGHYWRSKREQRQVVFQHDGASIHTAKVVKEYLGRQRYTVLDWPAKSPDLSPIENLWADLKRRLQARQEEIKDQKSLWEVVQEVWEATPAQTCKDLVDSMPRRLRAVINAKGGPTKY
jgi:transposase